MVVAKYIARRLVFLVPQLLLISIVTFVLIRLLPGDPARLQLGPRASENAVDALRASLKLDQPIYEQYVAYLNRTLHGDLGQSWVGHSSVSSDLAQRFPATLELIAWGLIIILVVFVPLGIITSVRGGGLPTRMVKRVMHGYGMLAGSLPDFWLGLLLIFVFFTNLGILPGPEGRLGIGDEPPPRVTGAYTLDALLDGDMNTFSNAAAHLVLPAITLAFVYGAVIFKMTQSTMSRALRADSTTFLEGFGLAPRKVRWYAFRTAAPPVVTMTAVITGYLLGGAVLIEQVFSWNGVGQYAVRAVVSKDYAPIQAFVLMAAIFTILVYLFMDLVYFTIDPRVRLQRGNES